LIEQGFTRPKVFAPKCIRRDLASFLSISLVSELVCANLSRFQFFEL
jgi:hypothetical protein